MPLGGSAEKTTEGSYANVEGMLINLGVVAALMLSFVVGVFFTIQQGEGFHADYKDQLIYNKEFRVYAVSMLDYENFNFTVPFPLDTGYELVNMRDILNDANSYPDTLSKYECELNEPLINCNRLYSDMQIVAEMTVPFFPQQYLYSYCTYHSGECSLPSAIVVTTGGYSVTALTIALFISVALYISLSLSRVREEMEQGNLVPLARFRSIAMTLAMIGFILLLIGVVIFFFGLVRVINLRSPLVEPVSWLILINLYCMLIPTGVVFTAVALYLPTYAMGRDSSGGPSGSFKLQQMKSVGPQAKQETADGNPVSL